MMNPNQKKILQDLARVAMDATLSKELVEELLILLVEKKLVERKELKHIYEKLTAKKP